MFSVKFQLVYLSHPTFYKIYINGRKHFVGSHFNNKLHFDLSSNISTLMFTLYFYSNINTLEKKAGKGQRTVSIKPTQSKTYQHNQYSQFIKNTKNKNILFPFTFKKKSFSMTPSIFQIKNSTHFSQSFIIKDLKWTTNFFAQFYFCIFTRTVLVSFYC